MTYWLASMMRLQARRTECRYNRCNAFLKANGVFDQDSLLNLMRYYHTKQNYHTKQTPGIRESVLCEVMVVALVNQEIGFRFRCLFHRGFQRKDNENPRRMLAISYNFVNFAIG